MRSDVEPGPMPGLSEDCARRRWFKSVRGWTAEPPAEVVM